MTRLEMECVNVFHMRLNSFLKQSVSVRITRTMRIIGTLTKSYMSKTAPVSGMVYWHGTQKFGNYTAVTATAAVAAAVAVAVTHLAAASVTPLIQFTFTRQMTNFLFSRLRLSSIFSHWIQFNPNFYVSIKVIHI